VVFEGSVPVEGGGGEVEVAAAGGLLSGDLGVLVGGGDVEEQCAEAAGALGGVLADGVGAEVEVVADGAGGGAPAGAAAVAAVDGGQGKVLVLLQRVGPAEGGGGGHGAVHAGDLAQPQVRFEVREGVSGCCFAGALVGEHGEQGGGEVLGDARLGHPRQHGGGELAQLGGAGGLAEDLADEGVGEEEVARGEATLRGDGARALAAVGGPEHVEDVRGEGLGVERGAGFEMGADGGGHRARGGELRGAERRPLPRRITGVVGGDLAGGAHELLEVHAGLGDHGVLADVGAEDGAGEVEHGGRGVGSVAEGGGGGDGGEVDAAGCDLVQDQAQASQQHAHVRTLRAVVGVELVEDQVAQRGGGGFPEGTVGAAQQQLVEHLVVRQQHVRCRAADHLAVGDERVRGNEGGGLVGGLPGVEGGGKPAVGGVLGEELREAPGLVVRERVHRVEDQRFDPAGLGLLRAGG